MYKAINKTIRLNITSEDTQNSFRSSSTACPAARAFTRKYPGLIPSVTPRYANLFTEDLKKVISIEFSEELINSIKDYDKGHTFCIGEYTIKITQLVIYPGQN